MKKILLRALVVIPAAIMQGLWYLLLFSFLRPYMNIINAVLSVISIILVLYIVSVKQEGSYKTLWLAVVLLFPLVGTIMYLIFGNKRTSKRLRKQIEESKAKLNTPQPKQNYVDCIEDKHARQIIAHLQAKTEMPMYPCEAVTYYPLGEELWQAMLEAMRGAEKFIFLEYFIVDSGVMLDAMVEIMAQKVREGVDVRMMYDDLGSVATFSMKNMIALEKLGIKCIPFNPFLFVKGVVNNRDHRKMLIIDGKTAFSGGINLADEYINAYVKYGHWKDIGFKLEGAAVRNYTQMFAETWNAFAKYKIPDENLQGVEEKEEKGKGYVLSYYDSPFNAENISNYLYVELLGQATDIAWFSTPYLMLGDSLREAFIRAAQRGVDVRILTPGVGDGKIVQRMGRSYYADLLRAGVKIYEYTPGFVHAKASIIDDKICTIGTVNLDYRSLFLHFENNSLFYNSPVYDELKADYLATQALCVEQQISRGSLFSWLIDRILQVFAPLC